MGAERCPLIGFTVIQWTMEQVEAERGTKGRKGEVYTCGRMQYKETECKSERWQKRKEEETTEIHRELIDQKGGVHGQKQMCWWRQRRVMVAIRFSQKVRAVLF